MTTPNLRATKNRILFQFVQTNSNGSFDNKTDWGFEVKNQVTDVKQPRWAVVKVVGKDVTSVKPGQYIFVEALMWTLSFTHNGEKYWGTNETKLIAMSDVLPTGLE